VALRLGSPVVSVNENKPSVITRGGEILEADIIIGADGKHSCAFEPDILTRSTLGIKSIVRNSLVTDSATQFETLVWMQRE
jgi:hypothetical protein